VSKTHLRRALPLAGIALITVSAAVLSPGPAASRARVGNRVLRRSLDTELGIARQNQSAMSVSSGVLYTLLEETGALRRRAAGFRPAAVELPATEGCQNTFTGNGRRCVARDQPARRGQHARQPGRLANRVRPLQLRMDP
jgi:hypothetical protein